MQKQGGGAGGGAGGGGEEVQSSARCLMWGRTKKPNRVAWRMWGGVHTSTDRQETGARQRHGFHHLQARYQKKTIDHLREKSADSLMMKTAVGYRLYSDVSASHSFAFIHVFYCFSHCEFILLLLLSMFLLHEQSGVLRCVWLVLSVCSSCSPCSPALCCCDHNLPSWGSQIHSGSDPQ